MIELKNHYTVLDASSNATYEIIRAVYRVMARLHHPDLNKHLANDQSVMTAIHQAYEVLPNPQHRLEYDLIVKKQQNQTSTKREHIYRNVYPYIDYSESVLTKSEDRGRLHSYM